SNASGSLLHSTTETGANPVPRNSALRAVPAMPSPAVEEANLASPALPRELPPELPESRVRYVLQAILAITALILLSPVLVLVAIAIKLTSPGPLFYRGVRTGLNQQLYTMYKFRTLREG